MRKVRKRTKEEIERRGTTSKMEKVGDISSRYFYVFCYECSVAYFKDDIIEVRYRNGKRDDIYCPSCGEDMYSGDEDYFDKYYELLPEPTNDSKPLHLKKHPQLIPWYVRFWRFITFQRPRLSEDNFEKHE